MGTTSVPSNRAEGYLLLLSAKYKKQTAYTIECIILMHFNKNLQSTCKKMHFTNAKTPTPVNFSFADNLLNILYPKITQHRSKGQNYKVKYFL